MHPPPAAGVQSDQRVVRTTSPEAAERKDGVDAGKGVPVRDLALIDPVVDEDRLGTAREVVDRGTTEAGEEAVQDAPGTDDVIDPAEESRG